MTSKHTPGSWTLWGRADPSQVIASESGFVAQTVGGNDEANARLIAAAPELLQALTAVVEAIEKGDLDDLMCCNGRDCGCRAATNSDLLVHDLRALIAKATGEQP